MIYTFNRRFPGKALLVGIVMLAGCTLPPPPPPTPIESSVEEIAAAFRQALSPMTSLLVTTPGVTGYGDNGRGAPQLMSDQTKASVLASVQQTKAQYSSGAHYTEALNIVNAELEQSISEADSQARWRTLMGFIETYEILNPGNLKMARIKERAQLQLDCPEVVLKGFFIDKEKSDTYAFFHVTLHPSNVVEKVQARKGEEFHGLRFVDIIGKRRGVILEYLAVPGQTFRVMGP